MSFRKRGPLAKRSNLITYSPLKLIDPILKRRKVGPVNVYSARVKKQNLMRQATDNLVDKVFGGSFGRMAAFLVDSYNLSEKDIDELKKVVGREGDEE